MTLKNSLIAFLIALFSVNVNAQKTKSNKDSAKVNQTNPLEGLRKAGPDDIDPAKPMMLNPMITPIYFEDLTLLQEKDFMNAMFSGEYMPEPYIDNDKIVKAFVLRKATEEEKKRIQQAQANMPEQIQIQNEIIGKEAIPFSVTDISGNSYSLESLKGKVVVINFWFVECKPCVMEMPELNELVAKFKDTDVVFLGFATNDKSKIESFLKSKTFNYNIIAGSSEIANMYNVYSFPTHLIIDKNSIISYSATGLGPNTIKEIESKIEELIK
jgi:peroxiredoxin